MWNDAGSSSLLLKGLVTFHNMANGHLQDTEYKKYKIQNASKMLNTKLKVLLKTKYNWGPSLKRACYTSSKEILAVTEAGHVQYAV